MNRKVQANRKKIGALLSYISDNVPEINLRKLIKLVFKLDEISVMERGMPVTWLDYYAWEKGPVAREIYEIKNGGGIFKDYVTTHKNKEDKIIVEKVCPTNDMKEFSLVELELIKRIVGEYGSMSAEELSDMTHEDDTLWTNAVEKNKIDFSKTDGKSEIRLSLKELISGDIDKQNDYENAEECMLFRSALMDS